MSHLSSLSPLPDDPILGLTVAFKKETRTPKVNLGVGAYKDEQGDSYLLPSVREAEKQIMEQLLGKEYLPLAGDAQFVSLLSALVLGEKRDAFFGMQTIAGTGALRLAIDLLHRAKIAPMHLSQPTWPNHKVLCQHAGMPIKEYRYYDGKGVDFAALCEDVKQMEKGSAILLQASCHNPTGCDPTLKQWKELSVLCKERQLFPLFDVAYQGFGEGISEDIAALRLFVADGHELIFTSSCSKIFGLYGERVGMLGYVAPTPERANTVGSHLKAIARGSYSTPPLHGARIVRTVLDNPLLKSQWEAELTVMRNRINTMRKKFLTALSEKGLADLFQHMATQKGMFSYSGLNPQQVATLAKEHAIYLPKSGRINVAGLTEHNIPIVVTAIKNVVTHSNAYL